jgi:hypothetical protein
MQQTDLTLVRGGNSEWAPPEPWAEYCDPSQVRKDSPRREGKCSTALGPFSGEGAGAVAGTGEVAIVFRRSSALFSIALTSQIAQESASRFRA